MSKLIVEQSPPMVSAINLAHNAFWETAQIGKSIKE